METNKQPKSASLLKKALIYRPFHKLAQSKSLDQSTKLNVKGVLAIEDVKIKYHVT